MKRIEPIIFRRANDVKKGWGKEVQITNHIISDTEKDFPTGYSGKLLVYDKAGAVSSLHFHKVKCETFFCSRGEFELHYIDLETAERHSRLMVEGDIVEIPPGNPHQVVSKSEYGIIIEFASSDYTFDNYRIGKGDSQNKS